MKYYGKLSIRDRPLVLTDFLNNCGYHTSSKEQVLRIPIAFDIIRKPEFSCDIESKKVKRKSHVDKNELMRIQIAQALKNNVLFSTVEC